MKKVHFIFMLLFGSVSVARVVPDKLVAAWSYEANPRTTYLSDYCAASIAPVTTAYQGIKAVKNQNQGNDILLRFTLGKMVYQTVEDAIQTKTEINSPVKQSSKRSKMCDMRVSFNVGPVVYFIHTDVGKFRAEMKPLLEKLAEYVQSNN